MNRVDAYRMIQRRTMEAGLPILIGYHTFRATGITAYLEVGDSVENAQEMAAHESRGTTKLYDRTCDEITLDEIERIAIWAPSAGKVGRLVTSGYVLAVPRRQSDWRPQFCTSCIDLGERRSACYRMPVVQGTHARCAPKCAREVGLR